MSTHDTPDNNTFSVKRGCLARGVNTSLVEIENLFIKTEEIYSFFNRINFFHPY